MAMNTNSEKPIIPEVVKFNNKNVEGQRDVANAFCEYFSNVGPDFAQKIPKPKHPFTQYLKKSNNKSMYINPSDPQEVLKNH